MTSISIGTVHIMHSIILLPVPLSVPSEGCVCVQTWEDWRQADVFHLLYDWLLVLLQERLLSSQAAHADSVTIAWFQILWVATITVLLLIVSAAKLVLTALRHLFKSGEPTCRFFCGGYNTCSVVSSLVPMQQLNCRPDQPSSGC